MRARTGRLTCRAVPTASRRKRIAQIAAALLLVAGVGVGAYFGIRELTADEDAAPAPPVALEESEAGRRSPPRSSASPRSRPRTTRVGGSDPTADAAGVALATFPSQGGVERPAAVTPRPLIRLGRGDRRVGAVRRSRAGADSVERS